MRHRLTRAAALGLALAALATPTAFAQQDLRSPDARDAARAALGPVQDLRSPDTRDVSVHYAPASAPAPVATDGSHGSTIALVLALTVIAGAAVVAVRRVPRRRLATAPADGTRTGAGAPVCRVST
jgi:hypothetical protein